MEMGGQTLRSHMSKSNPWPSTTCGDMRCFPCRSEKGGNCRRKNVGYCITCNICKAVYHGETSRNMFSRGEEHLRALENELTDSVLWNHSTTTCHQGDNTSYSMRATGYFREAMTRQIDEAIRIHHSSNTMNRKGEWKRVAVPRAQFIRE